MKAIFSAAAVLLAGVMQSQSVTDAAVQVTAAVQVSPPSITVGWIPLAASQCQVFRKPKASSAWTLLANLPGTASQYIDNSAAVNTSYEYKVYLPGSATPYGYVSSGINVDETGNRGTVILVVDSTCMVPLATEIARLQADLEGDGWEVIRHDVDRAGSVKHVKSLIVADYTNDPADVRCVFLLGHVPVPYSGFLNPDGHTDHFGAWPADVYYGDANGVWTDGYGPYASTASPARTQNYPNDGKFDQSLVPGDVELEVGRVDLSGLPLFSAGEMQLLKNYLDKDHAYRHKIMAVQKRAVIDDNFGYFSGEAFAASGYKNFAPLVGPSNVIASDYFTELTSGSYLWSYGCGGGTYTGASGVGTTAGLATSSLQGVFTMLFGSYFGDWDATNSFLKAPLAQGSVLTSVWSGRPHYQFHHMALGETIGYSLRATQNNSGAVYFDSPVGITGKWVHNALMGDPTLRNDVVAPPAAVIATKTGFNCNISWTASSEPGLAGYNVYMKNDSVPRFVKVNASPVTGTSYIDSCLQHKGVYTYMVRALKLESTPSGTYYNESQGLSDTAMNTIDFLAMADFTYSIVGNTVTTVAGSPLASSFSWDFGDGTNGTGQQSLVTYTANGDYVVTLIAQNACYSDTSYQYISITKVGLPESASKDFNLEIYPNPAADLVYIRTQQSGILFVTIVDAAGRIVHVSQTTSERRMELYGLTPGLYQVCISNGAQQIRRPLLIE